jgi:prepilin-type N-terminal cleavage/methylation domain-containing protein
MKTRGFTMLEILVATALTALVLIGLNTLIFSMAELWGNGSPTRNFDLHARSFTMFLEQEIRTASLAVPPTTTTAGGTAGNAAGGTAAGGQAGAAGGFSWQAPSGTNVGGIAQPLLTFTLPAGSRLLPWPARALPDVVCALEARADGLYLLWHSEYEANFYTDPPRETLLTPLVTALAYDYYDAESKQWTTATEPTTNNNGQTLLPGRMRLTFTFGNLSQDMAVLIPAPNQGLPPY